MTLPAIDLRDYNEKYSNIKPLQDRLLVRPLKVESLIHVPQFNRNEDTIGEVVAAGPGKKDNKGRIIPMQVQVGDKILFGKHAIVEILLHGERLLRVREDNVFAILD